MTHHLSHHVITGAGLPGRVLRPLALLILMVLVGTPPAHAADTSGRLRLVQVLEDGKDGVEGLYGAQSPTVSPDPDGANVYATSGWGNALAVFARDAQSGRLTFLEAQRNGVKDVDGLSAPVPLVVSPDGAHVYTASFVESAIAAFVRDLHTGRLSFVQAQRNGLPGPEPGMFGLAISPDGAHVYAGGFGHTNDVAVFGRDASSGMLTPIEVVSTGLPPTYALAVSPDGTHVYAAGYTGYTTGAVTAFQRDLATGRLTRLASWQNGVDGVQGLDGAFSIALSADGASVYVAGTYDHAVAVFARDVNTGLLSFVQAVSGVGGGQGLKGARGLAVSPDGLHLWAAGSADKAIALFSRDPDTGQLGFVEARRDVLTDWIGMGEAWYDPALSRDGRHLYQASVSYNALLVFSTDEGGMAPIVRCVGDCDLNSEVHINELVKGVNVALGRAALSACEMFDRDGSRAVTVNELVKGVGNALHGCRDPLTPGDHRRTLEFGGYSRIYDVHVPPGYDGSTPVPLILDFHGFEWNPTLLAGLSGWRALADKENFIVAYPLGLFGQSEAPELSTPDGPSFNAGGCCGGASEQQIDDVGFARAIVQAVAAEANVDRARIYATGHSNGGGLAFVLSCDAADLFAGVAPVATVYGASCNRSRPIPVIAFAGLHDPVVPYALATLTFKLWQGCSGEPDAHVNIGTSGASFCDTYDHCTAGVQVELCSVNAGQNSLGAGHMIYLNPDIDIPQTAWDFLSQFRLPAQ